MAGARRLHDGMTIPTYLHGAPGGGKSRMILNIAQAFGMEERLNLYSCCETDTGSRIIGFMNIANGTFVEGCACKAYEEGGMVVISEADLPGGGVMKVLNNLIEGDRFTFPNGKTVKRHPDFYLLVDANTIGKGSMGGFSANKLDAATRTRFGFLKIKYDIELERSLVPAKYGKWVDYVLRVRAHVEKNSKDTIYITPRATINGAGYLEAGVDSDQVCESVLFTDFSEAARVTCIQQCGTFTL